MVSNWLTAIPIKHLEYELTKQKLWNAFLIRYDWLLNSIPYQCVCEAFFNVTHAFWCKKGVFITLRHNEDITTELHNEACVNVRKEPILLELNTEDLPRQVNNIKKLDSMSAKSTFGKLVKEPFLTSEYLISHCVKSASPKTPNLDTFHTVSSLRDTANWKFRNASDRMKMIRNDIMVNEFSKLKMFHLLPWFSPPRVVWEKNAFVSTNS